MTFSSLFFSDCFKALSLTFSSLKVIHLKWIHSSVAILYCWLLALKLSFNLSKGSKHELQHLRMPEHIPPKTQSVQSDMFFYALSLFCSCQSAAGGLRDEMCLSTSLQDYVLYWGEIQKSGWQRHINTALGLNGLDLSIIKPRLVKKAQMMETLHMMTDDLWVKGKLSQAGLRDRHTHTRNLKHILFSTDRLTYLFIQWIRQILRYYTHPQRFSLIHTMNRWRLTHN